MKNETHPMQFSSMAEAREFILAGNAIITIVSKVTATRYTYKIKRAKKEGTDLWSDTPLWFVSLLTGPNNTDDYSYLGILKGDTFQLTKKSKMLPTSGPVVAFYWLSRYMFQRVMPSQLEVWHEGRCGRCNRVLTVPESLAAGIGPECAKIHKGGIHALR